MRQAFNLIVFVLVALVATYLVITMTSIYASDNNPSDVRVERVETHQCNWEDCDHVGQVMDQHAFTTAWGADEGTDAFYTELTHFMNPEMTYEECEDYVFSSVE